MGILLHALAVLSSLVAVVKTKLVITHLKQQIVLLDQVPIVNTAIVIKNEGSSNVVDYQLIFPSDKIGLIGQIDVEDGFGNEIKHEFTDNEMSLEFNNQEKKFTFMNFVFGEPLGPTREITIQMRVYYYGKYEFLPAFTDLAVKPPFFDYLD